MVAGDPTGSLEPPIGRIDTKARQLVAGHAKERRDASKCQDLGSFDGAPDPTANPSVGDKTGVLWMSHRATPELAHSFLVGRCG
jgi:hypothetical protein